MGKVGLFFYKFLPFSLVLALGAAVSGSAATTPQELAERFKFYASIRELQVHFHQIKHFSEMGLDLKSEGQLSLHWPDDILWDIQKPDPLTVKINASEIVITSGQGAAQSRQTFKMKELPKDTAASGFGLLKPWLMLDAEALSAKYNITALGSRGYRFEPKDGPKMFTAIEAYLSRKGHVEKLVLHERSGDRMEIEFDEPKIVRRTN